MLRLRAVAAQYDILCVVSFILMLTKEVDVVAEVGIDPFFVSLKEDLRVDVIITVLFDGDDPSGEAYLLCVDDGERTIRLPVCQDA